MNIGNASIPTLRPVLGWMIIRTNNSRFCNWVKVYDDTFWKTLKRKRFSCQCISFYCLFLHPQYRISPNNKVSYNLNLLSFRKFSCKYVPRLNLNSSQTEWKLTIAIKFIKWNRTPKAITLKYERTSVVNSLSKIDWISQNVRV